VNREFSLRFFQHCRVPASGNDEISTLEGAFNRMHRSQSNSLELARMGT